MALDRLTLRAKRSISGLFPFNELQAPPQFEAVHSSPKSDEIHENEVFDLEDFGSKLSPCKASPSRSQRLMGSLRKRSLRSIGSLRSLRSPTSKNKLHDNHASPHPSESPCTPSRHLKSSLVLDFQESPPGQPMFDLKPKNSSSSSLIVHHSSPMNVAVNSKQEAPFSTPVHPSIIPTGTIPTSPAPLQKALEMDRTIDSPSRPSSPAFDLSELAEALPTPMPGTNLAFEDIDVGAEFRNAGRPESASSIKPATRAGSVESSSGYFNTASKTQLDTELLSDHKRSRITLQCEDVSERMLVSDAEDFEQHETSIINRQSKRTAKEAAAIDRHTASFNRKLYHPEQSTHPTETRTSLAIITPYYYTKIHRRGEGGCFLHFIFRNPGSTNDGHDMKDLEYTIWARTDEEFAAGEQIVRNIAAYSRKHGGSLANCDQMLGRSIARGATPYFLNENPDLDDDVPIESRTAVGTASEDERRSHGTSMWGRHAGLYDGTGYGEASMLGPNAYLLMIPVVITGNGRDGGRGQMRADAFARVFDSTARRSAGGNRDTRVMLRTNDSGSKEDPADDNLNFEVHGSHNRLENMPGQSSPASESVDDTLEQIRATYKRYADYHKTMLSGPDAN